MCYLRQVVLLCSLFVIQNVWGASMEMSLSSSVSNENIGSLEEKQKRTVKSNSVVLGFTSNRFSSFQYSGSLTQERPDYSGYYVREHSGAEVPLDQKVGQEQESFFDNTIEYGKGDNIVQLSLFSHLTDSPFRQHGGRVKYIRTFYHRMGSFGGEYSYFNQKQPLSYFIDEKFKTVARPTRIYGNSFNLFYEMPIDEVSKFKVSAVTGQRINERPRHYGGRLEYAYSVSQMVYTQLAFEHIEETTGEKLLNDSGYYTLSRGEVELIVEPVFDLLFAVSYGLTRELEEDPRIGREVQVGTDSYSLGAKYLWGDYEASLRGSFSKSNLDSSATSIYGGIKWNI